MKNVTKTFIDLYWGDFNNIPFILLVIFFIVISLLIIFFIVSFSLSIHRKHVFKNNLLNESNTLRIFSINLNDNSVYYFDRIDLKNKKNIPLSEFYDFFNIEDVTKIKQWFTNISTFQDNIAPFLEVDTIVDNQGTHNVFSLLKLISYQKNSNILHLEMQTLKYLSLKPNTNEKKNSPIRNTTLSTFGEIINNSKNLKGFLFSLRFTYVNQLAFKESEEERFMILKLKNAIYPYINDKRKNRYICELNPKELLLVDLKMDKKEIAYQFACSIYEAVNKVILLNDYEKYFRFTVGIVQKSLFYKDFNSMLKAANEASIIAFNEKRACSFYERNLTQEASQEKNKELIDSLIKEDKIRYLFRPIVDVKGKKILGYIESIKTYDSSFSSYNEMMQYAHSCKRDRELFATVSKNVIPRYADENPKPKTPLFFPVSILDFENIETILPQITRIDKVHLVLIFEEQEISQTSSHLKELMNSLSTLKLLGYELALSMMDKNLLLDVNFYKIFDYFIAGTSMTGELKKNNVTRISLRTLIESLLKFKKPIIATGLEGWQSVELMVKSGVNFVSSEAISPSSEMVLPVEKKKFEKLLDFTK